MGLRRAGVAATLYCHWYKLEPSHVLSQDTPCPTPFQYPVSYLVLSYHDHRFYAAVGLLLLYYTVVTALLCAAVTSDPPVRFCPFIGPTPYDAKQYPAESLPSISS